MTAEPTLNSDAYETWKLVRSRYEKELAEVSEDRLHWRMFAGALTAAEMTLHLVGTEVKFCAGVRGTELEGNEARLARAATDSVVNDNPFPYSETEMTRTMLEEALAIGRVWVEPIMTNPSAEIRSAEIQSVLGPMIDGTGVLARLAYHPAYHQAQLYLIRTAPEAMVTASLA